MTNHQSFRCEIFLYLVSDVILDGFNDILCTVCTAYPYHWKLASNDLCHDCKNFSSTVS